MSNTPHKKHLSLCLLAGALLFMTLLTGCAQNPVTGSRDFVMLSEEAELEIGKTNHAKIIKQYGRYQDDALQAYVQQIGARLAAVSHRPDLDYQFTVIDSPIINAFALPGGYIYISRGLMAYLNSEAELAAVLGHEIGHVTARHGVRQQSAAQAANIGYTVGAILFPELVSQSSRDLFSMLGGALLSGYGREHELQSDALGAEYLARAGYEPKAMINVIKVLKNQELFAIEQAKNLGRKPQGYHGLFASHPDNDTRLHEVVNLANNYRAPGTGLLNRNAYLSKINGLVFGDNAKQGILSGHYFYHGPMGFALRFPENWYIDNGTDRLMAVAKNGEAILEVRAADIPKNMSPEMFIRSRLKINNLRRGEALTSNGLKGYTGVTFSQDQLVRVTVFYLNQHAFVFFGSVKDQRHFNQFDSLFVSTAKALRILSKSEQYLAEPLKINIALVKEGDSFENWASQSRISNYPLIQLRLLNDAYPSGSLVKGELVKRVE